MGRKYGRTMAKFRIKCKTKSQRMLEKEIRRFTYQVKNREKREERIETKEREGNQVINKPSIQEEMERWNMEFMNVISEERQ